MVRLDLTRLDDNALMEMWDEAQPLSRPWRELAVLEACCDEPRQALARVPIGIRDSLLLDVRVHLFGRRIEAESRCGACGERLDVSFDVSDILAAHAVTDPGAFE